MRRPKLAALWRHRPRVLTLAVLIVVVSLLILANLSHEITRREHDDWQTTAATLSFVVGESSEPDPTYGYYGYWNMSAGWPLVWRQHVFAISPGPSNVIGPYYSIRRLAANLVIWSALLAAAAGGSEWLLRRYRPRLRWSLRTMLVAVALAAAFCAWFAAASKRPVCKPQSSTPREENCASGAGGRSGWM